MAENTNNGKKMVFNMTPQQIVQYAIWFIVLISAWFIMQNKVSNNDARSTENRQELRKVQERQAQIELEVARMTTLLQTIKDDVKDIKSAVASDHN